MSEEGISSHIGVEAVQRLINSNTRLIVSNICLTAAIVALTVMMLLVMLQR